ncbi:hypothetical protein AB0B45_22715 [Nonomuraea sp. NPDC049152]|uniref:hypothetical protein n=1 Tax=Nonomuraea sp. NPDC049152 TaxID=3154350 RepID=UPI0033EF5B41
MRVVAPPGEPYRDGRGVAQRPDDVAGPGVPGDGALGGDPDAAARRESLEWSAWLSIAASVAANVVSILAPGKRTATG